jgi:hypothetical protein
MGAPGPHGCAGTPWLSLNRPSGHLPRSGTYIGGPQPRDEVERRVPAEPERRPRGHGYADEACTAALGWFAGTLPGEPVTLRTQTANDRSMRLAAKLGFTEAERFEDYGAEQWFGVWSGGAS